MTTPRVAEADGDDEGDESPVYEINPEVTPPVAPSVMRVSAILWPAFLMAGVIEMLVFAMVDPGDLHWFGGNAVELDRKGVYTMAFFAFWVIVAMSGALTQLILHEPHGDFDRRARTFP
jgi:hypothetical protein